MSLYNGSAIEVLEIKGLILLVTCSPNMSSRSLYGTHAIISFLIDSEGIVLGNS